jgi:hypothetical protein
MTKVLILEEALKEMEISREVLLEVQQLDLMMVVQA